MQNRLSPEFIQGLRQQQRINQMNQMQARRNNPRQRTFRPEDYQRQQLMQRRQPMQQNRPLFNQGRINEDFSVTITNPDPRGPYKTQNQSIAPKFRRPTQGGK